MTGIDEAALLRIEKQYASGLSSAQILDVFATHGVTLSEATLRKYVQLGLLPRSVRIGKKGKHQGSQGIYPVRVIREILRIKHLMSSSYTIEQIQNEVLFMRSDLQQLEQTLSSVFSKIDVVLKKKKREGTAQSVVRDVGDARAISRDLIERLSSIESKLVARARIERVAVS